MRDKALRFIRENGLLSDGDSVIVALSGGADSVCLLHILISLKELYHLTIFAAHFNHMIRGEEADRDESFCAALCARLGAELFTERADVPAIARESGESLELCGRRLRYEFFDALTERYPGAVIATAHNLNDNTETVLMNLVRGTGIGGLCGIPAKRGDIIRPLLSCSRDEIEAYCRENGLDYVTDSTNLSDAYTRNKLRLNVLPVLREMNPALDEGIQRTASLMRDADDYLNKISFEELNKHRTDYGYDCAALLQLDRSVLSYAVRRLLDDAGATTDCRHIELIVEAMRSSGAVDLGGGFRAECAQGVFRITGPDDTDGASYDLNVPFADYSGKRMLRIKGGRIFCADASEDEITEKVNKKFLQNCIPCDIITGDTVVRRRRAGDTFTDSRRGVTKTLKKLFNEMKIPREKRDSLLVVADGSAVLWIEGIGTSKQAQIGSDYEGDVWVLM